MEEEETKGPSDAKSAEDVKKEILKALENIDLVDLAILKGKRCLSEGPLDPTWTRTIWTVWNR